MFCGPNVMVSVTALVRLLTASVSRPWSVTPGTLTDTSPPISPAKPPPVPPRITKNPNPPSSVTKFVAPSPSATLTFCASTRTMLALPAPVAFSNAKSPLMCCPSSASRTFVPSTRR